MMDGRCACYRIRRIVISSFIIITLALGHQIEAFPAEYIFKISQLIKFRRYNFAPVMTSCPSTKFDNNDISVSTIGPTIIICPGNGCTNIRKSNWYEYLRDNLEKKGIPCVCENFPDPFRARREKWIPFIRSLAEGCESGENNVILVGHSSGAQATLRYAEQYAIRAAVLVSATYSDLGDLNEKESGYYPQISSNEQEVNKYNFEAMKDNCPLWHQFHSNNDPFIPLHEAERIRDGLGLNENGHYYMLPGKSHFFEPFSELTDLLETLYRNS